MLTQTGLDVAKNTVRVRELMTTHETLLAEHRRLMADLEAFDLNTSGLMREIVDLATRVKHCGFFERNRIKSRVEGLRQKIAQALKTRDRKIREMNAVMDRARAIDVECLGAERVTDIESHFRKTQ